MFLYRLQDPSRTNFGGGDAMCIASPFLIFYRHFRLPTEPVSERF